jgi:hypothetical protein
MPHAAAAVARLASGGQMAFSSEARTDPQIAALRRKVTLKPLATLAPWPRDRGAHVIWTMSDGSRHEAGCQSARGGADQPFDEATLVAKLRENSAAHPAIVAPLVGLLTPSTGDEQSWRDLVDTMRGRQS